MTAEGREYIEVEVPLKLRLVRGQWSDLRTWNWAELLDLGPDETAEISGPIHGQFVDVDGS